MRRAFLTTFTVAAVALPLGCGSDDEPSADEQQIREAAATFEEAIETRDPELFCSVSAPSQFEAKDKRAECLRAFSLKNPLYDLGDSDMSVTDVEIEGDRATADLANEGFMTLSKEDGTWYVTPIPTGG